MHLRNPALGFKYVCVWGQTIENAAQTYGATVEETVQSGAINSCSVGCAPNDNFFRRRDAVSLKKRMSRLLLPSNDTSYETQGIFRAMLGCKGERQ